MDILYGIIGLLGFEGMRVYKRMWAGLKIRPQKTLWLYIAILVFLSLFSGACAHALANGNLASALFIGFSVPTGIRSILHRSSRGVSTRAPVQLDDIEIKEANRTSIYALVLDYFD